MMYHTHLKLGDLLMLMTRVLMESRRLGLPKKYHAHLVLQESIIADLDKAKLL